MEDDTQPTTQPPLAAATATALSAAAADDARVQRLARRSQLRGEAERDPSEQERKRMESVAAKAAAREAKAAAREARRAAALAAQAAQWRSFGAAQRLFTDGIASCLGFLSLANFNSAAQTCKSWQVGAHAVQSLGQAEVTAEAVLPTLRCSPFRKLVQSFVCSITVQENRIASRLIRREILWGPQQLKGLRLLPNVTRLSLPLDLARLVGAPPIQYPSRLATASLELGCSAPMGGHAFDASSILHGFASCASLTRLTLDLGDDPISLTTLGSLKQLRHLAIDGFRRLHYTEATLHAIKTLPQLETLTLEREADYDLDLRVEWLAPLLTAPHQLRRLHALHLDVFCLWDNHVCMHMLPSLTSLTHLESACASVLALPVLAAFTKLEVLHLSFEYFIDRDSDWHQDNDDVTAAYDDVGCARLSVLVPHLTHGSLTELSLSDIFCDGESLATLCNSQPRLKVLDLHWAALSSLQPLSTLSQLKQLTIWFHVHSDPLPELFEQISACKSLQQLQFCFRTPVLSETQQRQLAPPSTVLPLLTSFVYSSRD